jgi:hypothetical protein
LQEQNLEVQIGEKEVMENIPNLQFQNLKENQKQQNQLTSCTPVKPVKNLNIDIQQEIKGQVNKYKNKMKTIIHLKKIESCPSMRRGKNRLFFAISPETIRNSPSVLRGKSKKTRGLFFTTSIGGSERSRPSMLRGKSKKTRGLF